LRKNTYPSEGQVNPQQAAKALPTGKSTHSPMDSSLKYPPVPIQEKLRPESASQLFRQALQPRRFHAKKAAVCSLLSESTTSPAPKQKHKSDRASAHEGRIA
jgi:hypothetical protein